MKVRKKPETVTVTQLRSGLREFIRRAKAGESIIITGYGKPDAVIGPVREAEK